MRNGADNPMDNPRIRATIQQATFNFATQRLADQELIEWAIALGNESGAEREAVREVFRREGKELSQPLKRTWELIFESWERPRDHTRYEQVVYLRDIKSGRASPSDLRAFVDGVRPWIQVQSNDRLRPLYGAQKGRSLKSIADIVHVTVSSGDQAFEDARKVVAELTQPALLEVASLLQSAILSALYAASLADLVSERTDVTFWQVHRVYFVPPDQIPEGGGEPDRHSRGFGLATKLLFEVVSRLTKFDPGISRALADAWRFLPFSIFRRLWAATARDRALFEGATVGSFLLDLSDRDFWIAGLSPEMAELRAARWDDIPDKVQLDIEKRILRGQPLRLFSRRLTSAEKAAARLRTTARELGRIQVAGGNLSKTALTWLTNHPDLPSVRSVTFDFNPGPIVTWGGTTEPEASFALVPEVRLLDELEKALGPDPWSDAARAASAYVAANSSTVLDMLAAKGRGGSEFPRVWDAFGHRRLPVEPKAPTAAEMREASKVATLVQKMTKAATKAAVPGLSEWFSNWAVALHRRGNLRKSWLHVWPSAVAVTNSSPDGGDMDIRALNSPAGKMMSAFLEVCPNIIEEPQAFSTPTLRDIRDALASAKGAAGEEVTYRFIADVNYFIAAGRAWAIQTILVPLSQSTSPSDWQAFSRSRLIDPVGMAVVAEQLSTMVMSSNLPDDTRAGLMEQAMWSRMLSHERGATSPFDDGVLQQMLRLGGDTVRVRAISAMGEYLGTADNAPDFDRLSLVVAPLVDGVWPKELALSSRGVSGAFARLPSSLPDKYADVAKLILPYVGPFDCWSMLDFGIAVEPNARDLGFTIRTRADGLALLALLDSAIGDAERSVIPYDLDKGLAMIRSKVRGIDRDERYQRLRTLARR